MARIGNYPTTYEDRKFISICNLRKWGYLEPGRWKTGTISWSRNGNPIGSIGIAVHMDEANPYLHVSYILDKVKEIDYDVPLVTMPSNLGKGNVWYFRCPFTHKRCRKLYSIDGYFMHRVAVKGYYEKQIQSKHYRHLEKTYGPYFQRDQLYEQLYSKHFRKFYKDKPTKRYQKIMARINAMGNIDERELLNAMVI